jgi:hypothetical protein
MHLAIATAMHTAIATAMHRRFTLDASPPQLPAAGQGPNGPT